MRLRKTKVLHQSINRKPSLRKVTVWLTFFPLQAECTSSEEELLPDNQQAMHIWQICDIHARDFVGMAGQARPIRLEAVRAECDRTGDPEGNFQKVMLIEAVLFPVRYLKKRH